MNRPRLDQWWMDLAHLYAKQATCPRAIVGAMIANYRTFVSAGYNGAPSGEPHCIDDGAGCDVVDGHCVRARHAERNALEFAGKSRTSGATLYTTHFPCMDCARLIVEYGIVRVVYDVEYRVDGEALQMLRLAGVDVERVATEALLSPAVGVAPDLTKPQKRGAPSATRD